MPPGSNPTEIREIREKILREVPPFFLHEQKCSEKIHELYSLKNGKFFWIMGAASWMVIGTWRGLPRNKGRTFSLRPSWPYWLTGFLALASTETYGFHVSFFFK